MPANLENSAVATGLEKVSFHPNPQKRQCQRMLKLPHNCTHYTVQQSDAQNSPSQASIIHKLTSFRCSSWMQKKQRNQRSNCQHPLDHICFIDYTEVFDCVDHNKLWKIFKEMGIPDHLTGLQRNLYAGQEATLELDMEQQTVSKQEKEQIKAVYCHPDYLTSMQSTS